MRDPESEISKTSKSVSDSITSIISSHYSYLMLSYSFYNSYESFLHQTLILLHQILIHNKSNNAYINILNFSLISENNQMEKLMNYVDCLIIKTLSLAKQLIKCKETLRKERYIFKQFQKLSDTQFTK